jgi:hypothetical protein
LELALEETANLLWDQQGAEESFFEGVILNAVKDLLFALFEGKADPSVAQNRRGLRMTLLRVFQQCRKALGRGCAVALNWRAEPNLARLLKPAHTLLQA